MKKEELPKILPVFPLSNFIIFPRTTVPLNIFEPRYIQMVDKSMKSDRIIGMIQPKLLEKESKDLPELYSVGCMGKIVNLQKTDDERYLIELKGLIRFNLIDEILTKKKYREFEISFDKFYDDLDDHQEDIKFSDY